MGNKRIGKLKYSLALRKSNPSEKNSEKKVYAVMQSNETIGVENLVKHMKEHNTPFTGGTLKGVLSDALECIIEQMLAGNRVNIPGLGTFYVTISSQGVDSASEFNPAAHVTAVTPHILFDQSYWDDMASKVDYELTTTREEQAKARKDAKAAIDAELGVEGDDDTGGGGGDDQTE